MIKTEDQIRAKLKEWEITYKEARSFSIELDEADFWISALTWVLGEKDERWGRTDTREAK